MRVFLLFLFFLNLISCSSSRQIGKSATRIILKDPGLQTAHIGISIFDPSTNQYVYDHQGDKYFVPASNTKIPTCYAAMKYLGDSLVGIKYGIIEESLYNEKSVIIQPTGDPTFMHSDFTNQPVYQFLTDRLVHKNQELGYMDTAWKDERWGSGWSWNDYEEPYMAERSPFPIYGNTVTIDLRDLKERLEFYDNDKPIFFKTGIHFFDSLLNTYRVQSFRKTLRDSVPKVSMRRGFSENDFYIDSSEKPFSKRSFSFVTVGPGTTLEILKNELNPTKGFSFVHHFKGNEYGLESQSSEIDLIHITKWIKLHSQPTDSVLKPMMHRSDNFFAEQILLMVSNEKLGVMNDAMIIDTLLKTDFKDLPQKPRWVDGSGLSRYNLFTPRDLIFMLNKMRLEFGMERLKNIFPSGNEGTLTNYYKADSGFIYAKTGTLSGVVALSGFLVTKKNKLLVFSVLVNNHQAAALDVRRAIEKFMQRLRNYQ